MRRDSWIVELPTRQKHPERQLSRVITHAITGFSLRLLLCAAPTIRSQSHRLLFFNYYYMYVSNIIC